ncbi:MAG TPA: iron-containing alcohol dehydrogenase [Burkholderiales bacterium]|nr:iron-containing alcohol dehydrogenase [Burkholderiales bacterium]
MRNFTFENPVKIVFGKNQINSINRFIPKESRLLLVYGKGSIKSNGIYEQVLQALMGYNIFEFAGIEVNPEYATLIKAVELCKKEKIDYILAVGGGSVIDGVKFISAAVNFPMADTWQILKGKQNKISNVIKFGVVLTLPATGSEMNSGSVISRRETGEKLAFGHSLLYPQFAILDPEVTYSLPPRQLANGIVDPFIHVTEQYITTDLNTPIQDGFAETILKTLINLAPKILSGENDYNTRADWMWSATNALNGYIGNGVDHDWATHKIGHELTALYGLDHAQTLAIIAPQMWRYKKNIKKAKLVKFALNVWQISKDNDDAIEQGIRKTEDFFRSIGIKTKLSEYNIKVNASEVANNLAISQGVPIGEHKDIFVKDIIKIIEMAY